VSDAPRGAGELAPDPERFAAAAAEALGVGIWLLDGAGESYYRNRRLESLIPGVHRLSELAAVMPGVPLLTYVAQVAEGGSAVAEPAALLKASDPARLVQLRLAAGPPELPGSVLLTLEEVSDRLRVERLRALAETTVALGHEINNPLAILSGQIELLSSEVHALHAEEQPAAELLSSLRAMAERVAAMREAVTRIAEVLRRMRRVAEPLGADYLPSRGVRMLDLRPDATDRRREPPPEGGQAAA
jgi:nitrogen-specific signal transduction histidine kinase